MRLRLLIAVTALAACAPARAIYLSESNGAAWLSGPFEKGDDIAFAKFLAAPRPAPLRVLWLNSQGGALAPSAAIGRMVRRAGLTTAVDAQGALCDSACTMIFVAGRHRHYVNGQTVFEGLSSQSGLGFHGANLRGNAAAPTIRSEEGTRLLYNYYRAYGVPGAIGLASRAALNTVLRPNGATALRLGIATSLSPP